MIYYLTSVEDEPLAIQRLTLHSRMNSSKPRSSQSLHSYRPSSSDSKTAFSSHHASRHLRLQSEMVSRATTPSDIRPISQGSKRTTIYSLAAASAPSSSSFTVRRAVLARRQSTELFSTACQGRPNHASPRRIREQAAYKSSCLRKSFAASRLTSAPYGLMSKAEVLESLSKLGARK